MAINREELAWAAGFFDGEGNTCKICDGSIKVAISQVERSVLDRFHKAVGGLGKIQGPYGPYGKRRAHYKWRVHDFEGAQAVIALLWNFLSKPKKDQARKFLTQVVREKRSFTYKWEYCKYGHKLSETRMTFPGGATRCRLCYKRYQKEYKRRKV